MTVEWCVNEKNLLDYFINKMKLIDPDLIVCHGMTTGIFDVLSNRINFHKTAHWSWLGWYKMKNPPKSQQGFGGFWHSRQMTIGRLICDTFNSAKELIRETNYNLTELAWT